MREGVPCCAPRGPHPATPTTTATGPNPYKGLGGGGGGGPLAVVVVVGQFNFRSVTIEFIALAAVHSPSSRVLTFCFSIDDKIGPFAAL